MRRVRTDRFEQPREVGGFHQRRVVLRDDSRGVRKVVAATVRDHAVAPRTAPRAAARRSGSRRPIRARRRPVRRCRARRSATPRRRHGHSSLRAPKAPSRHAHSRCLRPSRGRGRLQPNLWRKASRDRTVTQRVRDDRPITAKPSHGGQRSLDLNERNREHRGRDHLEPMSDIKPARPSPGSRVAGKHRGIFAAQKSAGARHEQLAMPEVIPCARRSPRLEAERGASRFTAFRKGTQSAPKTTDVTTAKAKAISGMVSQAPPDGCRVSTTCVASGEHSCLVQV